MSYDRTTAFVRVPQWWLEIEEIDAAQLGLLVTLASYTRDDKPTCFPEQSTLAERVGRSRSWVNGALSHLCELGLVQKTARYRQNRGQSSNLYRIAFTMDQMDPYKENPSDYPLSQETTPAVAHDDTNKNKHKYTHSDFDLEAWRPEADTLRLMEMKIGAERAKLYLQRFIQRCKKQYHYRVEELDLALRKWFSQDAEKWAGRAETGSARKGKAGHTVPLRSKPDDRVSLSATTDDAPGLDVATQAVARAVEAGQEVDGDVPDQVRFAGACASFLASRGRSVYQAWLSTLEFVGLHEDGRAMVRAKSGYHATYVSTNFGSELETACRRAGLTFDRLVVS